MLARRPTPAVAHNRTVEFGTVSNEKKAFGTVSLINKGSRKASFSITWDKKLPVSFSPSEVRGKARTSAQRLDWKLISEREERGRGLVQVLGRTKRKQD